MSSTDVIVVLFRPLVKRYLDLAYLVGDRTIGIPLEVDLIFA